MKSQIMVSLVMWPQDLVLAAPLLINQTRNLYQRRLPSVPAFLAIHY